MELGGSGTGEVEGEEVVRLTVFLLGTGGGTLEEAVEEASTDHRNPRS